MLQKHARYLNIIKDFTEVLRIFIAVYFYLLLTLHFIIDDRVDKTKNLCKVKEKKMVMCAIKPVL